MFNNKRFYFLFGVLIIFGVLIGFGHSYAAAKTVNLSTSADVLHALGDMTIDGKLGIGTSTPSQNLEVYGVNPVVKITQNPFSAGSATIALTAAGAGSDSNAATLNLYQGSLWGRTDTAGIRFGSADKTSTWGVLGSSVGIGTTIPGAKLDVVGGTFRSLSADITGLANAGNVMVMADNSGNLYSTTTSSFFSNNNLNLWSGSTGGNIWNANSGNMGIGTTNPVAKVNIIGDYGGSSSSVLSVLGGTGGESNYSYTGDSIDLTGGTGGAGGHGGVGGNIILTAGAGGVGVYDTGANGTINLLGGNVGIGTTNPSYSLEVAGPGTPTVNITGANSQLYVNNIAPNTGSSIYVNANVGIGTANPSTNIQAVGAGGANLPSFEFRNSRNGANNYVGARFVNTYGNHSWGATAEFRTEGATDRPGIIFSSTNAATSWGVGYLTATDDNFRISTNYGYTGGNWGTTRFLIDTSGNVGIGTTIPGTTLDVVGAFRNSQSTTHSLLGNAGNAVVMSDNTGNLYNTSLATFVSANSLWSGTKNGNIYNGDAGAGNVGIGTTAPGSKLDVQGGDINTSNYVYANELYTRDNVYLGYMGNWLSDLFNQSVRSDASPTFQDVYTNGWFRNNGANTGLYNQATQSHFYSSSAGVWNIAGGAAYPQLVFRDSYGSTVRGYVYSDSSGFGLLNSNGGWSLRTAPGSDTIYMPGNVGIGTTDPGAYKLNVDGNANFSGSVFSKDGGSYPFFNVNNNNYKGWYKLGTFSNSASNSGEVAEIDLRTGGGYNGSRAQRIFGTIKLRWGYPGVIEVSSEFSEGSMQVGYTANANASTVDVYLNLQLGYASAESYKVAMLGGQYITWTDTTQSYIAGTPATVITSGVVLATANNVGIRTTGPESMLSVGGVGDGAFTSFFEGAGRDFAVYASGDTASMAGGIFATGDAAVQANGNTFDFYGGNTSGKSYFAGKVGIGTTGPGTTLDVVGTFRNSLTTTHSLLGNAGNAVVMTDNNGTLYNTSLSTFVSANSLWSGTKNGNIYNGDAGVGNVGIGTTIPSSKLDIVGPSGVGSTNLMRFVLNGGYGVTTFNQFYTSVSNYGLDINSGQLVVNRGSGFVGIGTTAPSSKLDVAGTIHSSSFANPSSGIGLELGWDGNYGIIQASDHDGGVAQRPLALNYGGGNVLLIPTGTGNVGIGTTNPGAFKLNVNGPSFINGTVTAGSFNAGDVIMSDGYLTNQIGLFSAIGDEIIAVWNTSNGIYTYGNGQINVLGSGNVGIGTTGPGNKLDVNGNITVGNADATYIVLRDDESPNGKKYIHANSNNIGFLSGGGSWIARWDNSGNQINVGTITAPTFSGNFSGGTATATYFRASAGSPGTQSGGFIFSGPGDMDGGMGSSADGTLQFFTDSTEKMRIDPSGNITMTGTLSVTGSVGGASFNYNSDRILKKNIETIQSPLEKILQLRGVTFNWKKDNSPSVGLIAQEVETVFPELVTEGNGIKSVQYGNLVAPLIEAVKEQQKEIEGLNNRIKVLEAK